MKILFLVFIILLLVMNFKKRVIKENFENPDEKVYISCGNKYIVEDNIHLEPLNGLYTKILEMKYKGLGRLHNKTPICNQEIHNRNDKNTYDYFNSNLLEDPYDPYSKPDETHKPILYGFDIKVNV